MDKRTKEDLMKFINRDPKNYILVYSSWENDMCHGGAIAMNGLTGANAMGTLISAVMHVLDQAKYPHIVLKSFIDALVEAHMVKEKTQYERNHNVRAGAKRKADPKRKGAARKTVAAVPGRKGADRNPKAPKQAKRSAK